MLQNYISYFDKCMNAFLTDFVTALKDKFPDTGGCSWFWETYLAWNARPNPHRFPLMYSRTPPGRTRYTACGCTRCTSSVRLIHVDKGVQNVRIFVTKHIYLQILHTVSCLTYILSLMRYLLLILRIWFESFSFYYSFGVFFMKFKEMLNTC